jgi:DNA-binding transcriptional MocR family regulator
MASYRSAEVRFLERSLNRNVTPQYTKLTAHYPGLPHPSFFPIAELSLHVQTASGSNFTHVLPKHLDTSISATTASDGSSSAPTFALARYLQYGPTRGEPALLDWLRRLTERLHTPQYADWDIVVSSGSGDSIEKSLRMLCQPGDKVLVDAFTFPSTLECMQALDIVPVSVGMDEEGMSTEDLVSMLDSWDEATQGGRPRCMCEFAFKPGQLRIFSDARNLISQILFQVDRTQWDARSLPSGELKPWSPARSVDRWLIGFPGDVLFTT